MTTCRFSMHIQIPHIVRVTVLNLKYPQSHRGYLSSSHFFFCGYAARIRYLVPLEHNIFLLGVLDILSYMAFYRFYLF